MTTTILVLGATSAVGSSLISSIPDDPAYAIRAAVRPGTNVDYSYRSNVVAVPFDYMNPATFDAAFAGVDKVFLAAPLSPAQPAFAGLVANLAKEAGVEHIVLLSSLGADKAPDVPLFSLYRQTEQYIEDSGLPFTHLRTAPFMDNFLSAYAPDAEGKIRSSFGFGAINWISANDVGAVAGVVLTGSGHEGKAYDLTGQIALTMGQATALIGNAVNRNIIDIPASSDEVFMDMAKRLSSFTAESMIDMHGIALPQSDDGSGSVLELYPFVGTTNDTVAVLLGRPAELIEEFATRNAAKFGAV